MSIQLIAVDLDGTLLDNDKQLSEQSRQILAAAAAGGVHIVPITGRNLSGIEVVLEALPSIPYAIVMNGAEVHDLKNRRVLHRADIPPGEADAIFEYMDRLPVIYDSFQDGCMWTPREHYALIEEYSDDPSYVKKIKELKIPIDHFRQTMRERNLPCQKIQAIFKYSELRTPEMRRMQTRFPAVSITSSLPNNMEITDRRATKGEALRHLCRHIDVPLRDTMAIGDNENDLSMFACAGVSVAMGNASERVKGCAGYVTGSNTESGAARAIQKFVLEESFHAEERR